VPDSPNGSGNPAPEELKARLKDRERRELAEIHLRLSAEPCACPRCVEEDVEERESRLDRWYGY
jgi:hypothetical protein